MKMSIKHICCGIVLMLVSAGAVAQQHRMQVYNQQMQKMNRMVQLLNFYYVDTIDLAKLIEKGTEEMLKELDPHSVYIPKKDVTRTNEPLQANFEGIGVQFQIIKDTLVVVEPVKGGPAEMVGIVVGDKFVMVDDTLAVGKICTNDWMFKHLRGKKGTKVVVKVKRGNSPKLLTFTITRDKIPINSIESYFMADDVTGYIKLERFSQTAHQEFVHAVQVLKEQGMQNLIFDLRDNGGGFLNAAVELADEFLPDNKLVVYTQNNQDHNKITYNTHAPGCFEQGKLVVLINEYSASASEIVSGAIQDWDRGVIIGRRSFGKGLVQSQVMLPDSSLVRLTTSRYYIPSGRCIQKPYEGVEDYSRDAINRYNAGELTHADSIHFPDSLKFYTAAQRVVYGGGGIMPDIFVPMDTLKVSDYYWQLFRNNMFNQFIMSYIEGEKNNILAQYPTFDAFYNNYMVSDALLQQFYAYARNEGVIDTIGFDMQAYLEEFWKEHKDTVNKMYASYEQFKGSNGLQHMVEKYIADHMEYQAHRNAVFDTNAHVKRQLKTLIARRLYASELCNKIWLGTDETYLKALEVIQDKSYFKKHQIK